MLFSVSLPNQSSLEYMITRRSVRIKAMQYLYAYETTQVEPSSNFQQQLEKSILSVKDQYLYLLLAIREVANFVEQDARIKASKFIKKESDKNFNTKLLSNFLVQFLNHDEAFLKAVKQAGTLSLLDENDTRRMYKRLCDSETYRDYLNNGMEFNMDADRDIMSYLLYDILLEDEVFAANTEEQFTNWADDAEYVVEAVDEVIRKSKHDLKLHFGKNALQEKFKELTQFGIDLFNLTVEHKSEGQKMIEPKLKNWEADRLAVVDVILIRMALSEFLYFPSIPVKVTINEYLDIAKEYSTPKSKDFINGVLDSLMKDLKANEQILKSGRGLL